MLHLWKTTHIAELLEGKGKLRIWLHENKLIFNKENAEEIRLNIWVKEMECKKMDSLYVSSADKVLIDVPCSGIEL